MEALVRANPERLVWGGDWPHPRMETEMPDGAICSGCSIAGRGDAGPHPRVTNPAKVYDFPG